MGFARWLKWEIELFEMISVHCALRVDLIYILDDMRRCGLMDVAKWPCLSPSPPATTSSQVHLRTCSTCLTLVDAQVQYIVNRLQVSCDLEAKESLVS